MARFLALLTAFLAVNPAVSENSALSHTNFDVALRGRGLSSANMTEGQAVELEEEKGEEKGEEKQETTSHRMMAAAYWSVAGFAILSLACPPAGSYAVVVSILFFIIMMGIHYARLNEARKAQFKKDFVQKWYLLCACPCLLVYIILFVPVYTIDLDRDQNMFCKHAKNKYEHQITWGLAYVAAWIGAILVAYGVHHFTKERIEEFPQGKKAGVYLGFFLGTFIFAFLLHLIIQAIGAMPLMLVTFVVFSVCLCGCLAVFEKKVMAGDDEESKAEVDLNESLVSDKKKDNAWQPAA